MPPKIKQETIRVFPKIGGTPKWMVYNGNPYGGTIIFGNTHTSIHKLPNTLSLTVPMVMDLGQGWKSLSNIHMMKFKGGVKHPFVKSLGLPIPKIAKPPPVRETGQKGWNDWKSYWKNWVLVPFLYETVFSTRLVVQLSRLTATSPQDFQHLELQNVTFFALNCSLSWFFFLRVWKEKNTWPLGWKTKFYLANTRIMHQPWVWPLPSNSDHQDYYIFSRESL